MRILFVCLGNICRSPLAEALFLHKTTALGYHREFTADSCGTSNYNLGDTPDHRTVSNAWRNGVQMQHIARQLTHDDFVSFDRILVMDRQNLQYALKVSSPSYHSKIALMRSFDPMGEGDVPDPFYGSDKDFQQVFEILDRTMDAFIRHLVAEGKH